MKSFLYIDADTNLEFENISKAFRYVHSKGLTSYIVLTKYPHSQTVSVYNPFLVSDWPVEYLKSESEALKYIGSFLVA